ncbi:MAG TPA: hypothetical protein DIC42_01955 [Holosporales bacterium]|nr:hypothetical protein [Holosporales bacterium]
MRSSFLTMPLLSMIVIFLFCLENSHKTLDFSIVVSFLYLLPAILLVQEVVSSIQSDLKDGIIENWLGNGASSLSYLGCKIICFSLFLAVPFVILVCGVLLLDYPIEDVFYVALGLFFLSITFISFGCLMGLSYKSKAYIGILLLPLAIPSFLWLISGIETGEYKFPLMLSFGMTLMSVSLSLILSNSTTKNLF